jgi:hypothetical protein
MTTQLQDYGVFAAILGIASFIYIAFKHKKNLILLLWTIPVIIETQNEAILFAIHRIDLTWSTLAKPLEGFRFYCFLAQPLAIAIGVTLSKSMDRTSDALPFRMGKIPSVLLSGLLLIGLFTGIHQYRLDTRFQTSGLTVEEYEAATWFKANSAPSDRIIADYYRVQMIGGVCGGKALLGGVFPLRNVDYPYIKAPGVVQNDLFILYNTSTANVAYDKPRNTTPRTSFTQTT